ncbi:NrdH-redoxin [Cryobacterium sp. Hh7]|uniref:glutaredoxin family protein n=1 Tax=Cryobacterium sp. Hh7 TaxID=1259159 RepID=UPI00106B9543|nr:glutaredoxin family protein [Cryobacterium sp. Hh7]TFD58069.1 NrdH-redoxin [Cryobacterium sp. Hh7]
MSTPTPTVTVYTKDDCRQCVATKAWLTKRDIAFTEVDILTDPKNLEGAKSLGLGSAPVVIVSFGNPLDDVAWAGFNPNKLTEYLSTTNTETSK